jgi:hypothetical protein
VRTTPHDSLETRCSMQPEFDYCQLAHDLAQNQMARVIPMPLRNVPKPVIDPVARAADAVALSVADFVMASHAAKTPEQCVVIALEIDHLLLQLSAAKYVALDAASRLEPVA